MDQAAGYTRPPRDPRACPTCGLWQRTRNAAAVCPDPAHAAQRGDEGHQFHLSVTVQGEGDDWVGEPFRLTVRAWSLSEACAKASAVALPGWTLPDEDDAAGPPTALDVVPPLEQSGNWDGSR